MKLNWKELNVWGEDMNIKWHPLFEGGWLSRENMLIGSFASFPAWIMLLPTTWLLVLVCLVCYLFNITQPELTQLVTTSCLICGGPETHKRNGRSKLFCSEAIRCSSQHRKWLVYVSKCDNVLTFYRQFNPQMNCREETTVNSKKNNWKCLFGKYIFKNSELPQKRRPAKKSKRLLWLQFIEV